MDNQPPVMKIKDDRLQLANKALIAGFAVSVTAIVVQFWVEQVQFLLYISLPVTLTALMYEIYVRYKLMLKKEERAPDWSQVKLQKEIPTDMSGNKVEPPTVQMPKV